MPLFFRLFTLSFLFLFFAANISAETWKSIDSDADLAGKWEGSASLPVLWTEFFKTDFNISVIMEYNKGNTAANTHFRFNIKLDVEKMLDDLLAMPDIQILGFTKDLLWDFLYEELKDGMEDVGKNVVVKKYYVSCDLSESIDDLFLNSQGTVLINDKKDKLIIKFNDALSLSVDGDGDENSEIVLKKVN
jgi:hypothetical protein